MEPLPEKISKNEQKRRAKQLEKEQRRNQQPATPQTSSGSESENMPHQHHENRLKLFQSLRSTPSHHLYPSSFEPNVEDLAALKSELESIKTGEQDTSRDIKLRGRIIFIRSAGKRLRFYVIQNGEEQIQIVSQAQEVDDMAVFLQQHEHLGRGDIIGVIGHPGRTAPRGRPVGELSIFASEIILLAPCLQMIPKDTGFTDAEQRHRNRPLDLIANRSTRDLFRTRHQMNMYISNFLSARGYISVETPILNQTVGGASAKPFTTYHNALKRDLFLRIATELPLKQLVVGGLDRVFEIGRVFRNEDIDLTHNPEFTSCEFYQADANYNDMMSITENWFPVS
ncbi:lysyl-tRNA synthetase [Cadophora gregata]|uniref:lysyl-tRNA synthetase n=1 Tax=Cadophora gregata TaxID=51156 RepID=UPI0026DAA520|nr:lysyl-tRNA synthetase [Cadophora gregata]KAK0101712.1 lysyl-tRNA synthetase [Cadophora gregata]